MDVVKEHFSDAVRSSLAAGTFVRLVLGKYRGKEQLDKVVASTVSVSRGTHMKLVFKYPTKDVTQVVSISNALNQMLKLLGSDFLSGTLFTTQHDVSIIYNRRHVPRVQTTSPTFNALPSIDHNREKQYLVDNKAPFLKYLDVTDASGRVKSSMSGKFRQICKFVEIIDSLLRATALRTSHFIKIVDIGSGKGYLTFALYDHLTRRMALNATVTGVEQRGELCQQSNDIALRSGFTGLRFQASHAEDAQLEAVDVLIALHACNIATDAAIYQGVKHDAALIVCAPCCHQEIAPQLSIESGGVQPIVAFGLLKQRQAEIVTDTARALLLKAAGYKVKVFEFVSMEHTDKNVMIAAVKTNHNQRFDAGRAYAKLKDCFGFHTHSLEVLLSDAGLLPQLGAERREDDGGSLV